MSAPSAPGSAAGRELFVYYRVPAGIASEALGAATAFQAALRIAHPGLQARLLRRCEAGADAGGADTWMETYALPSAPGGVDATLQEAIEAAAASRLATFIDGARHVEAFEVVGAG